MALSGPIISENFTKYGALASQARLAQWLLQRNELSPDRLGLVCGFQQKKLTKLLGLSESASLSHRYLLRKMNVLPQKMNSLSTVGVLSEFV